MNRTLLWGLIAVVALVAALGLRHHLEQLDAGHPSVPSAVRPLAVGELAPDLRLTDPDGHVHALSEFQGRPVLVNLWALWCSPCMQELPLLQQAQSAYGRDRLTVLAVGADSESNVVGAVGQHRLDGLVVLMDTSSGAEVVAPLAGADGGLPHTVLLDAERRVRAIHAGSFRNIEQLRGFIDAGLAPGKQTTD
jgi:thiol-disulfide isomerase/thioredoxin